MKHLNLLNRASSVLILVAIAALFATALYALWSAEKANAKLDIAHQRLDTFRTIAISLQYEDDAIDVFTSTTTEYADSFFVEATQINRELDAALEHWGANAGEKATLLAIRRLHDAHVITTVSLIAAVQHHRTIETNKVLVGEYLPQTRALNRFIFQHISAIDAGYHLLDVEVDQLAPRLLATLLIAGFAALGIAMVLLCTTNVYRRRSEQALRQEVIRLEESSLTDSLTDLGNHRAFYRDLADQVARSQRYLRPFTLAVIDIDHFKTLNDTKGHEYGDDVLNQIGEILKRLRAGDNAYRLGGDAFALLLTEADTKEARFALGSLQQFVRSTFPAVTLSIGFAEWKDKINDHDLRECAQSALSEAKRRGRNTIVDFEAIRDTVSVISSAKGFAFQRLLSDDDALSVAFQPIWSIDGSILGFEALARPAPDLGFNGPQEAFDVAERLHRIIDLDLRCMRRALQMASALPAGISLFVNISPETLVHPSFDPEAWLAEVRGSGIAPSQIVVEVTERSIIYPALLVERAMMLRSLGARLALDDTGAGYAGLEVLSLITFDFVKIDRGLMLKAQVERGARGVLAGVISIAQETGALLIAEGIETFEQLDFVTHVHDPASGANGVRAVQGYLFGKPRAGALDPSAFTQYAQWLGVPRELVS